MPPSSVVRASIACALCCGCGPTVVELPTGFDAELFAAIALSSSGEILGTTGVVPIGEALELELEATPELIDVIGWSAAELPGYAVAGPSAARAPLEVGALCAATLEAPRAVARVLGAGPPTASSLALSSPAIPSARCLPGWSRALSVEPRCLTSYCAPVVSEEGCAAVVDLSSCNAGRYRVSQTSAAPCVETLEVECAESRALELDARELSCTVAAGDCALRFFPFDDPGWATVERRAVIEVAPAIPSGLVPRDQRTSSRHTGYLSSLFRVGGRTAVVSHGGVFREPFGCRPGRAPSDDVAVWLDAALRPVATSTLPFCTSYVAARPTARAPTGPPGPTPRRGPSS